MSFVLTDKPRPHVSLVTLNRPERMNAMAFDVMIPLRRALEELSLDNDTRVVVLTGAGDAFCSGADLEDSGVVPDIDGLTTPGIAWRAMELLHDVIIAMRRMHQPIIGAINGAAIGGGFCLACRHRHPHRIGAGVLPRCGDQQRPDVERARYQLPPSQGDRRVASVRDPALGT